MSREFTLRTSHLRKASLRCLWLALAPLLCFAAQEPEAPEEEPSKDLVIERIETAYKFNNDGTAETVQKMRVRALTEAGRNGIGQVYFPFTSQTEEVRIDYFRTVKPDGSVVAADPAKALEIASPVSRVAPTFTDLKFKGLVAPSLEVGDSLEYQSTTTVHTPLKAGDFWVIHFANRQVAVESETVSLNVPAERRLTFQHQEGVPFQTTEEGGRRIYRWEASNPKVRKSDDPPQEPLFSASTLAEWKDLGDWYITLQSGRGEVTPEIQALAEKLTAGKATAREKLDALYAYVSQSIRYVQIAFGIGGYQAHPAAEVLRNGYGDCKDKHGLLAALLSAAGLKSYPVLLNTERGVIEPKVPVPSQFDHVITAVPLDGQLLWMDTTSEVAPLGFLVKTIRGKQALLIEPGGIRLAEVHADSPVKEEVTLAATGSLDSAGKLTVENNLDMRGHAEVIYRKIYRLGNKQAIDAVVKILGAMEASQSTTEASSNSDPTDMTRPFNMRFKVTKGNFVPLIGKEEEISVPHPLISRGTWSEPLRKAEKKRRAPPSDAPAGAKEPEEIDLGLEGKVEETFDVEIDPIYEVDLPIPVRVERSFATFESSYTFDKGRLRTRRTLITRQAKISPDRWQELDSFAKLVDRDLEQEMTLRRTGKVDVLSRADQMSADELNAAAATLLEDQKEFSLARDLLLKATAKDPKHKWAWNNLGRAYAGLASYLEAEKAYKKQLEINPNDEYTYKNLGWVYGAQKRFDDSEAAYRKGVEVNPLDKEIYGYLAWTLSRMEKWEAAAEAYGKQAALNRDQSGNYVSWGYALLKAGKHDDARKQFERALSLDSSPTLLNNVAYFSAEAGIDLDKSEERAKKAVAAAAQNVAGPLSLDASPEYNRRLLALGAYLDTLGWVYFQQGKLDLAEPLLLVAYELQANATVAEHVARIYVRQDKSEEALRYYALAQMWKTVPDRLDAELEDYVTRKAGGDAALHARVSELKKNLGDQRLLKPRGPSFAWPPDLTPEKSVFVELAALIDAEGAVTDAKILEGDERFREAALADARRLRLPPLSWPEHSLPSVRTISFLYIPARTTSEEKRVRASWGWGKPAAGNVSMVTPDGEHLVSIPKSLVPGEKGGTPSIPAEGSEPAASLPAHMLALQQGAILFRGRDLDGAIGRFRQAIEAEPHCAVCHRALADTLAQKGDRGAAIAEYQEVARIEPENPEHHFMLGAQFEAEAATQAYASYHFDSKTRTSRPGGTATTAKASRSNYESALEQYRLAHQLAPDNKSYKDAFERMQRQLRSR